MVEQALVSVFANAAVPQKILILLLIGAIPFTLGAAALALRNDARSWVWRRLVSDIRLAAPALGLLVGALNSFHMGRTMQRLPFNPTAKQLAPGVLEVSTLVGLGAFVGVIAVVAHLSLGFTGARERTP